MVGLPSLQGPGDEGRKANGDIEVATPCSRLGRGRLIEFLQTRADGQVRHTQHAKQHDGNAAQSTPVSQDRTETVKGQDSRLRPRKTWESRDHLVSPRVKCIVACHGRTLRNNVQYLYFLLYKDGQNMPTGHAVSLPNWICCFTSQLDILSQLAPEKPLPMSPYPPFSRGGQRATESG